MAKFEVELPKDLAEYLSALVRAGLFASEGEAIAEAVERRWASDEARIEAVRAALAPGVAEADAGIFYDGGIEDIIAEAKAGRSKQK